MSVLLHPVERPLRTAEPVTLGRVLRSQWLSFRTLRSTVAVLVAAAAGMVAIALVVAYNTRHVSAGLQPDDLVPSSTLQGYYLGQLLIGALGVLFVSGEYSTGMVRSTFTAVPKRLPVLWAKLLVFLGVVLTVMVVSSVVAFLAAQALLAHYRPGYSLSDPGVLRIAVGTGVYLALVGLLGSAIAWVVRSTPGSLVAYFAVILVLPVLLGSAFGSWGRHVAEYFPSSAGGAFVSSLPEQPSLSPWVGLAVLLAWVAAAVAVAAVQLRSRDV